MALEIIVFLQPPSLDQIGNMAAQMVVFYRRFSARENAARDSPPCTVLVCDCDHSQPPSKAHLLEMKNNPFYFFYHFSSCSFTSLYSARRGHAVRGARGTCPTRVCLRIPIWEFVNTNGRDLESCM